jgi:hypothetical protein
LIIRAFAEKRKIRLALTAKTADFSLAAPVVKFALNGTKRFD